MHWLIDLALGLNHFYVFMLVLARISGLAITAPVLGGVEVPMQVRALVSIALALLLTPAQLAVALSPPGTLLALMFLIASELLVGVILGLGVTIVISGLQLAGYMIGQLSGMSLAEVYNPSLDANVSLAAQLLYYFALAIFLVLGGHRMLLGGLLDTFATMPLASATLTSAIVETLHTLVMQSFSLGIRAAAPATVALLLATLILGMLSRTLPQLNVMSLGFGLNAFAAFGSLWFSLGSIAYVFHAELEPALEMLLWGLGVKGEE